MSHRYMRLAVCIGLCILILGQLASVRMSAAQADQRCFSETGHCMSGRFRQYWEQNGGLAIFGFPLYAAAPAVNQDTGEVYLTQGFERNRFELHPENAAPYDVQLGRLGVETLLRQGRDWQTLPKASADAAHYFAETGHAIAYAPFWNYWSTHGLQFDGTPSTTMAESTALFGLPISEPAMEQNASGDTVLTQWFERARFEYHPHNPAPFQVMLGLLGSEVLSATADRYFWPTTIPQALVVTRDGSAADSSGFTLRLVDPAGGQFYATILGGPEAGAGVPRRGQSVVIRGQPGLAFTTGAGYTLSWVENDWPYRVSSGLGLEDALQLANGLEPLSLAAWQQRLAGSR